MTAQEATSILNFLAKQSGRKIWHWYFLVEDNHAYLLCFDENYHEHRLFYRFSDGGKAFPLRLPADASFIDFVRHMFCLSENGARIYTISTDSYHSFVILRPFKSLEEILIKMDLKEEKIA